MTTQTFELTAKQKEVRAIFATAAKYLLVYGGSRSGKTFFICYSILVRAIKAPGSRHAIFRRHGVAVKQSIGKDTLPKVIELAFPGLPFKWHEQDGYFSLGNGSEIWLAGLDDKDRVDKVLGREFATLYFNEASEIPLTSYMVALTRLAQQVRQTDGRMLALKCYVDLNPTTAAHWTYQMWIAGVHPDGGKPIDGHAENYRHVTVNPSDNADNLSADYLRDLAAMPERQRKRFFDGQFTADDDNALWRRSWIKIDTAPELGRIVVAVDPATTNTVGSDETGIIVCAIGKDGRGYVLADESGKFRPEEWARRAISLFDTYQADAVVAEVNQGGDMVEAVIKAEARGRTIPVRKVTATRAKHIRAEPIAAMYEQGKVRHVEEFTQLVDQLCAFTIGFDRKSQGYSPDRCLAAGTMITTINGDVPIESVSAGDMVLTRKGYRRVLAAGMTTVNAKVMGVSLSNGAQIVGTANHPVYVKGLGFIDMDALVCDDILVSSGSVSPWQIVKSLCSMGLSSSGIQAARANPLRDTFTKKRKSGLARVHFTGLCGKATTGQYQEACTFTTLMGILGTIVSRTLPLSLQSNMQKSMKRCTPVSSKKGGKSTLQELPLLRRFGTNQTKEEKFTHISGRNLGKGESLRTLRFVLHAEKDLCPSLTGQSQTFAEESALKGTMRKAKGIMRAAFALVAVGPSLQRKASRSHPVPVSVRGFFDAPNQNVFNLTVDGENEYFANGVLVHNCDALVWGMTDLFPQMVRKDPPAPSLPVSAVRPMAGRWR